MHRYHSIYFYKLFETKNNKTMQSTFHPLLVTIMNFFAYKNKHINN